MKIDDLRKIFSYDPESGCITYVEDSKYHRKGDVAGFLSDGYVRLSFKGRHLKGHRVAWALFYGTWPKHEIDHKNRVRHDNRLENLREASDLENTLNRVLPNRHGIAGVNFDSRSKKNPYTARISYFDIRSGKMKRKHLGCFSTAQEAHEVYDLAARMAYGEFYHGAT